MANYSNYNDYVEESVIRLEEDYGIPTEWKDGPMRN